MISKKQGATHRTARAVLGGLALAAFAGVAVADRYNLQPPVTPFASEIYDLHLKMLWICIAIFVLVFSVMFYSIFRHRKSVGHQAAQFHENTTVEILWTVIPLVVLLAMMWPATKGVLAWKDTGNPDLTIKVTGLQWKWAYDYLKGEGEGISFYSTLTTPREAIEGDATKAEDYLLAVDNEMVVPIGKKVRILTTADDVIHAFWVPAFGIKQDAIPGFIRDIWFKADQEGVYRGQCAELCGKDHGFMPIVVKVVSAQQYTAWVGDKLKNAAQASQQNGSDPNKQWTLAELTEHGSKVYAGNCVACHQATGQGAPPAFPALSGSKVVNGPKDAQIVVLLNGIQHNGTPTAMVSFKQLSDTDIASVITYTRNSWANKTGEAIQPAEIKARR